MSNNFTEIKNIFVDGEVFDYVNLDKSAQAYERLVQTLDKPLKLILFLENQELEKLFYYKKSITIINSEKV